MKYTFTDLAKEVLIAASRPMSASEIWEQAVKMGLDIKLLSDGKTPMASLGARLYADVKQVADRQRFFQ